MLATYSPDMAVGGVCVSVLRVFFCFPHHQPPRGGCAPGVWVCLSKHGTKRAKKGREARRIDKSVDADRTNNSEK